MKYDMKLGKERRGFRLHEDQVIKVLLPNHGEYKTSSEAIVKESISKIGLNHEISKLNLNGDSIAIVVSKKSYDFPIDTIIDTLVDQLSMEGCKSDDIFIVLTLNTQKRLKPSEKAKIVGEKATQLKIPVIEFNDKYCVPCGEVEGVTIEVFEPLLMVDHIICVDEIQYHPLTGYRGGWMTVFPGVCKVSNTQKPVMDIIIQGILEQHNDDININSIQKKLSAIQELLPIRYFVNGVMGRHNELIACECGEPQSTFDKCCEIMDNYFKVPIEEKVDIVIASAGGYPYDMNLYSLELSISNAHRALKENGAIILVASAKDGFGEYEFAKWMKDMKQEERIERLKEKYSYWGFKATYMGKVLNEHSIYLVSDLDSHIVKKVGFKPTIGIEEAYDEEITLASKRLKVLLMPDASYTMPYVISKETV